MRSLFSKHLRRLTLWFVALGTVGGLVSTTGVLAGATSLSLGASTACGCEVVNACVSVPNVTFTATEKTKTVLITNCSELARADVIAVTTNNEAEFVPAKTCETMSINPLASCSENVTYNKACKSPVSTAILKVEANPGGREVTSKLTGC